MPPLSREEAWDALAVHHREVGSVHMRELFAEDPQRFAKFSLEFEGMLVDWSKQELPLSHWT